MDIWDEIGNSDNVTVSDSNKYIDDPEQGYKLLCRLLGKNYENSSYKNNVYKLRCIVETEMLDLLGSLGLKEDLPIYNNLLSLTNKLAEQKLINIISGKSVIGIGGRFSAGKSSFINTFLGDQILPEDQRATTSIPTYITSGSERLAAFTMTNMEVSLDKEAVIAMSHSFDRNYNLGLSQVIRNILIRTPKHNYSQVVILDTPGFSKAENDENINLTDKQIAIEHLRASDYLIWVVDMANGGIKKPDLEILRSINITNPILVVFNKAEKYPEDHIQNVLNESKRTLKNAGIPVYKNNLVAYSSRCPEEYDTRLISSYFETANRSQNHKTALDTQLREVAALCSTSFSEINNELYEDKGEITRIIFSGERIDQLQSLIDLFFICNLQSGAVDRRKWKFEKTMDKLKKISEQLNK